MKRILLIGDSITDAGRLTDPEQMGTGYVRLIHDYLRVSYPQKKIKILNKGVSGDRVTDLANRWEEDVINHHPDILSISIGVNDVWRQLDGDADVQVYPDEFKEIYDHLLRQVRDKTTAQIVLMEPTIIEEDIHSLGNQKLAQYVKIVQQLAEKYEARLVRTHEVFMNYLQEKSNYPLTTDGVHMNTAGNMLMAKTWLHTNELIIERTSL